MALSEQNERGEYDTITTHLIYSRPRGTVTVRFPPWPLGSIRVLYLTDFHFVILSPRTTYVPPSRWNHQSSVPMTQNTDAGKLILNT